MTGHPDIQEMHIAAPGLDIIKEAESWQPRAYRDSGGKPTIGWGHTKDVRLGTTITEAEGEELLRQDLEETEGYVKGAVLVPLTQNQFDALVSLVFNIGIGSFMASDVLKRLNRLEYVGAAAMFHRHNIGFNKKTNRKEVLGGLVTRRAKEAQLFMKDDEPTEVVPEPVVTIPPPTKGEGGVRPEQPPAKTDTVTELVTKSNTVRTLLATLTSLIAAVATMLEPLKKNPMAAVFLGIVGAGIAGAVIFRWRDR